MNKVYVVSRALLAAQGIVLLFATGARAQRVAATVRATPAAVPMGIPGMPAPSEIGLSWLPSIEFALGLGFADAAQLAAWRIQHALAAHQRRPLTAAETVRPELAPDSSEALVRGLAARGIDTLEELERVIQEEEASSSGRAPAAAERLDRLKALRYRLRMLSPLVGILRQGNPRVEDFATRLPAERAKLMGEAIVEHAARVNAYASGIIEGRVAGARMDYLAERGTAELLVLHGPYLDERVAEKVWRATQDARERRAALITRAERAGAGAVLSAAALQGSELPPPVVEPRDRIGSPGADTAIVTNDSKPAGPPSNPGVAGVTAARRDGPKAAPPATIGDLPAQAIAPSVADQVRSALSGETAGATKETWEFVTGIPSSISDEVRPTDDGYGLMNRVSSALYARGQAVKEAETLIRRLLAQAQESAANDPGLRTALTNVIEFIDHSYLTRDIAHDRAYVRKLASLERPLQRYEGRLRLKLSPDSGARSRLIELEAFKRLIGGLRAADERGIRVARPQPLPPFSTFAELRPAAARFTLYAKALLEFNPSVRKWERESLQRRVGRAAVLLLRGSVGTAPLEAPVALTRDEASRLLDDLEPVGTYFASVIETLPVLDNLSDEDAQGLGLRLQEAQRVLATLRRFGSAPKARVRGSKARKELMTLALGAIAGAPATRAVPIAPAPPSALPSAMDAASHPSLLGSAPAAPGAHPAEALGIFATPTLPISLGEAAGENQADERLRRIVVESAFAVARSAPGFAAGGGIIPRKGKRPASLFQGRARSPALAIRGLLDKLNLYDLDCGAAVVLVLYKTILDAYGPKRFNKLFSNLVDKKGFLPLSPAHPNLQAALEYRTDRRLVPGGAYYFRNPDYSESEPAFRGLNAIFLERRDGEPLFFAHGINGRFGHSLATEVEIIERLRTARRSGGRRPPVRDPGVSIPSYQRLLRLPKSIGD